MAAMRLRRGRIYPAVAAETVTATPGKNRRADINQNGFAGPEN